jgi:hypothetical protein
MLNNLTNFFNLIVGRMMKKTPEATDLIALGTRDTKYTGRYKPTGILYSDFRADIIPYKAYTALLNQSNLDEPVALELENTLGITATYSYVGVGQYLVTFDQPIFSSPDEYVTISQNSYIDGGNSINNIQSAPVFFNALSIESYNTGIPSDDIIGAVVPCILEIRIYNT